MAIIRYRQGYGYGYGMNMTIMGMAWVWLRGRHLSLSRHVTNFNWSSDLVALGGSYAVRCGNRFLLTNGSCMHVGSRLYP